MSHTQRVCITGRLGQRSQTCPGPGPMQPAHRAGAPFHCPSAADGNPAAGPAAWTEGARGHARRGVHRVRGLPATRGDARRPLRSQRASKARHHHHRREPSSRYSPQVSPRHTAAGTTRPAAPRGRTRLRAPDRGSSEAGAAVRAGRRGRGPAPYGGGTAAAGRGPHQASPLPGAGRSAAPSRAAPAGPPFLSAVPWGRRMTNSRSGVPGRRALGPSHPGLALGHFLARPGGGHR